MVGKILIIIGVLILILIAVAFFSIKSVQNTPPPKLVANFVNLDKIEKISKYRSCQGHVVVPQSGLESRRNMKHYFDVKKEFIGNDTVEIYAPYEGYISAISSDPGKGLEGEIWISPVQIIGMLPPIGMWNFSVEHINVKQGLKVGDKVRAGDLLGYAALTDYPDSFDIVYGKLSIPPKNIDGWTSPFSDLDSVFNHMSDEAFDPYQKKGITSKESLIMSKEARDQNPCKYSEGIFLNGMDHPEDLIILP
ncbi:MAG: hypothetical protein Q7S44_02125 [bacterium]|nr:hypothetical protein [bacterium]